MRQILCTTCGRIASTPVDDIGTGKVPRRNEARLKHSALCDMCNKKLDPGDVAIALSFPRDMKFWESDYFNF